MSQYFPKNVKRELDWSSYATKVYLKGATGIDTFTQASKRDLVSLKTEVCKLDIDKLKRFSADLGMLSNVDDNDVVKKIEYDKLKKW